MEKRHLIEKCSQAMGAMGLSTDISVASKMIDYLSLLARWNQVHNLTAIRDIDEMLFRHILDSLSIVPYLQGPNIVDVGSGSGLPGIPISVYLPDFHVTLIECLPKRVLFLQQAIRMLSLGNVSVIAARVEDCQGQRFDTIVTRAFAKLPQMLQLVRHLCDNQSKILAMKGSGVSEELSQLPNWVVLEQEALVSIPTKDWQHRVLVIRKTDL